MLILLDEPTLGLSPVMTDVIFDLLVELHERGRTVVLVEQNARRPSRSPTGPTCCAPARLSPRAPAPSSPPVTTCWPPISAWSDERARADRRRRARERGTYALLALGISLIFGVMHLVDLAHAELITVGAYVAYYLSKEGVNWWVLAPAIVISAVVASVATERIAFRWVRGSSEFTMLLTSFAVERLSHALWAVFVGPTKKSFAGPSWAFDTFEIGGIRFELMDAVTIAVTAAVLALTAYIFRRTLFGISVRAASEDFDAARLMGARANGVIVGAFAFAGFLAGVAAVLILMRSPSAEPTLGADWLIKALVAAIIGGLGSFSGAVAGGFALGLAEVTLRGYLPEGVWERLTDAFVFLLIAALFIIRPRACSPCGGRSASMGPWPVRLGRSAAASLVMWAVTLAAATLYTSSGGAARDLLVQELLVNLVMVMGLQVFIGSTGILSFGHLAFAQIAAYGVALTSIPVAVKASTLPDVPFGLADVELGRWPPRSPASPSPSSSACWSASPSPAPVGWRRR